MEIDTKNREIYLENFKGDFMKTYIGTKIIKAEPMDEFTFDIKYGAKDKPGRENRNGYHVIYPDNYNSWSPKEVFETAYRELTPGEIFLVNE